MKSRRKSSTQNKTKHRIRMKETKTEKIPEWSEKENEKHCIIFCIKHSIGANKNRIFVNLFACKKKGRRKTTTPYSVAKNEESQSICFMEFRNSKDFAIKLIGFSIFKRIYIANYLILLLNCWSIIDNNTIIIIIIIITNDLTA